MSYNQEKTQIASGETGVVKWFNPDKGYGFITCDNGGQDVFVHINQIQRGDRNLNENDQVTFDLVEGRKDVEEVYERERVPMPLLGDGHFSSNIGRVLTEVRRSPRLLAQNKTRSVVPTVSGLANTPRKRLSVVVERLENRKLCVPDMNLSKESILRVLMNSDGKEITMHNLILNVVQAFSNTDAILHQRLEKRSFVLRSPKGDGGTGHPFHNYEEDDMEDDKRSMRSGVLEGHEAVNVR